MDTDAPAAKRSKVGTNDVAHMIPGVDGKLQFGFPKQIITTIRYCDVLALNVSSLATASQNYRANGIFDPDSTGTGHQPMYRDQYAGIYDHYVVLGSKIEVKFHSNATNPTLVTLNGDDDSTVSTTDTTRMEANNGVFTWVQAIGSDGTNASLFMTYSPNSDLGIDAKADGAARTLVSADPAEQWYFCIRAIQFASTALQTVYATVEIEYTVKFSELTNQAQN